MVVKWSLLCCTVFFVVSRIGCVVGIGQQCSDGESQDCSITSIDHLTADSLIVKEQQMVLRNEFSYTVLDNVFSDLRLSISTAYYGIYEYQYPSTVKSSIKSLYDNSAALYNAVLLAGKQFSAVSDESMRIINEAHSHEMDGKQMVVKTDLLVEGVERVVAESKKLHEQTEQHTMQAENVLQLLFGVKDGYVKEKAQFEKANHELRVTKAKLDESKAQALAASQKAQNFAKQAADAKQKAKKKIKKKKKGLFGLAGVFYEVVDDVFGVELLKKYESQEKEAAREQAVHEQNARKEQEKYNQAEKDLSILKNKMSEAEKDIDRINTMISSLREVIGSCKNVAISLLDLVTFWDGMGSYCKQFRTDISLLEDESSAIHKTKEHHLTLTEPFRLKTQKFYAKWFALKLETNGWLEKRQDGHGFPAMEENLTRDQVKQKLNRIKTEL